MKKLISLLLSIAMLLSLFTVQFASAEESETGTEAISFLEAIGIMDAVESTSYGSEVTREGFAYYAAKAAGIEVTGNDTSRRYTDVPTYSYAFSAINNLADAGIISPASDGKFRPNDYITYGEAYTIMFNTMGYKNYAAYNGAWPLGYVKVARMLNIPVGDTDKAITLAEAAELIYKSIKAPLYDIKMISNDKTVYTKSDETLLSTVFKIDYAEGTFEAFSGGAIESSDLTDENMVKISGETYEVKEGLDISQYFGDYVEFFYRNENNKCEIIYIHAAEGGKDNLVIDIDDYESCDDKTFTYYGDKEGGRTKQVTLARESAILYNGMPLLTDVKDTLAGLNKGTIVFKDSDNDGSYDLACITDYKNFVVRVYDANGEIVYDKLSANGKIELANANYVSITSNGEEIGVSSLISDLVLSVAMSQDKEVISILASGDLVKGEVQSIGDEFVTIDGTKYEVENSYKDKLSVSAGDSYTFHMDSFGKIAYVSANGNKKMKLAYLIKGTEKDDGFEPCMHVKMFTEDGEMVYLDFADKATIDGVKKKNTAEIKAALLDSETGNIKPQLVEYEVNGDGKIKNMDTSSVQGADEEEDYSLRPVFGDTKPSASWWGQSGRYMFKALLNTQIVAIMVPEDADADDKYYRIGTWQEAAGTSASEWWAAINMYWRSDDSAYVDAIVKTTSTEKVKDEKNVVMVTELGEVMNKDEEIVTQINGVDSSGGNVSVQVKPELCDAGIDTGDLVVVSTYMTEEPATAKLVYDASNGGEPVGFTTASVDGVGEYLLLSVGGDHAGYRHATQISFGYAKKVFDEGVLAMSRYVGGAENERMVVSTTAAVYDSSLDEVYVGSIADIMSYEDIGSNCSKVFYHTYLGVGRGLFIYK